ncbi:MAG: hypothetical protein LBB18_00040, partial [Puniceicoccales bacterium]|nr:hypothetical protein [Puniceicoccales bacterium]
MNNLTNQSVNGVSNFILRTSFAPSMNPPPPCIDAPRSINLFSGLNTAFSMFVSIPPLMTYQNSLFSVEPQRDDNAISSSSTAQFLHSTKNHSGDDSISSEKRHGATYPICAKGSVKICNSLECTNKIDS